MYSGDGVFAGSGMDADGEGAAACYIASKSWGLLGEGASIWLHVSVVRMRLPKMAVPMRTQVLPSSTATAKSLDMPMESCVRAGWRRCCWSRSRRRVWK